MRNEKGQFTNYKIGCKYKPIIGDKYGKYIVISEELAIISDKTHYHFKVRCQCGKEKFVRADWLVNGSRTCCKSCKSKEVYQKSRSEGKLLGFIPYSHKGVGELTKTVYSHYKTNAEIRNLEFNVSIEFLWALYEKQNGKCKLSGIPIVLTTERKNANVNFDKMTASLDRIDSTKDYTEDNVQWVHKHVNMMKQSYSQEYFIEICKAIAKNNE